MAVDPLNENFDSRDDCNAIISKDKNILHFGCRNTVIPTSVFAVEEEAFGDSLPALRKYNFGLYVGNKDNPFYMFYGLEESEERTFVMDDRCELIRDGAFKDQKELSLVQVSSHVKAIPYEAFKGCVSLKAIVLPPDLTSIDYNAFQDCTSLKEFTFPKGIEVISYDVLRNCYGLERVTVHSGLKEIKLGALRDCDNLKKIIYKGKIEDFFNIKGIEEWLFDIQVNQIEVEADEGVFTPKKMEELRIAKEEKAKEDITYHDEYLGCSYKIPYNFIAPKDVAKYELPEEYFRVFIYDDGLDTVSLSLWKKGEACNEEEYIKVIEDFKKDLQKEKANKMTFEHYYQGERRIDVFSLNFKNIGYIM